MSTLKTKLELDQLTNAEHKENPTPQQEVLDEAGAFVRDILQREINPTDVVIVYREAGGGFGMYSATRDPLITTGLLAHAMAGVTKKTTSKKDDD